MMYPMVLKVDPFLGEVWREMTAAEYDAKIQWFRDYIKSNEDDRTRRGREYVNYLKRWFGDGTCDGLPNFKARHNLHQLPMSYNIYMNH